MSLSKALYCALYSSIHTHIHTPMVEESVLLKDTNSGGTRDQTVNLLPPELLAPRKSCSSTVMLIPGTKHALQLSVNWFQTSVIAANLSLSSWAGPGVLSSNAVLAHD